MTAVRPRSMKGAMELLPLEQVAFQRMLDVIRDTFERHGFLPVETPVMEYVDVLLTKSGGDTEKQVYFAQSTGSREKGEAPDLALRFDLTVPLARYVAEHENQLLFPFRRYQIQRVYRGESAQRGRYREFYQCDVDIVGKDSLPLLCDAEIPVVVADVFERLAVGPFQLRLNNRKLLRGLLRALGIVDDGQQVLVLRELDKLDKRERAGVRSSLCSESVGLSSEQAEDLLGRVCAGGSTQEVLGRLESWNLDEPSLLEGANELRQVCAQMRELGLAEERFQVDLAICRGLDYYTGTVYETVLLDHPQIGSVCSGGRYEDLAGHYTRSHLPGVGISIGASRLFYQLREAGLLDASLSSVDVLVTQMDADLGAEYRQLAAELRRGGLRTQLFPSTARLAKQMKFAHRSGIPLVVLCGSDEQERGTVTLKDMRRGDQNEVARNDLVAVVRDRLDGEVEP